MFRGQPAEAGCQKREEYSACSAIDSVVVDEREATAGVNPNMPGGDSAAVPPDPMPNSAVKRRSADGSVGSPHARVGHCQALNTVETLSVSWGFLRFKVLFIYSFPLRNS